MSPSFTRFGRSLLSSSALVMLANATVPALALSLVLPPTAQARTASTSSQAAATETQNLILVLAAQPQHDLASEIKAKYTPTLESYSERIKSLYKPLAAPSPIQTEKDEVAYYEQSVAKISESTRKEIDSLNAEIDKTLDLMRHDIAMNALRAVSQSQMSVESLVESVGGKVSQRLVLLNALAVTVPSTSIEKLKSDPEIAEVVVDVEGKPELDVSAPSLGADDWWAIGDDGGPYDVGILDSGVDETHPALSGHDIEENYATNGTHGTGVAGIYGSTDATHRGLAYGLDGILVDNAGSTGTSMAGADWMLIDALQTPEVINYSWGNGLANTEDWSAMAKFVDAVVNDCVLTWAKSTGNEGFGTTTITVPANNYNGISVANINNQNTTSRSDDVITASSSRGPTFSGRKKPDITASGTNTYTTNAGGGWQNLGGTSSAAPHVGASALLLEDNGVWDPKAIKAILINTADTWSDGGGTESTADDGQITGSQWNKTYGWAIFDLSHAAFHRNDYFRSSVKPRNQTGSYKFYKGYAFTGDKATLVWERRVDYNDGATPNSYDNLSDLNLRMYSQSNGSSLASDLGALDNVHQVSAPSSGNLVVKVYAWSTGFDGATSEPYALATEENFVAATGPVFTNALIAPTTYVGKGKTFTFQVKVSNTGDLPGHAISAVVTLPTGFSLASGSTSVSLTSIGNGSYKYATWSLKTSSTIAAGSYYLPVKTTSSSYGETFTKSSSLLVKVQ